MQQAITPVPSFMVQHNVTLKLQEYFMDLETTCCNYFPQLVQMNTLNISIGLWCKKFNFIVTGVSIFSCTADSCLSFFHHGPTLNALSGVPDLLVVTERNSTPHSSIIHADCWGSRAGWTERKITSQFSVSSQTKSFPFTHHKIKRFVVCLIVINLTVCCCCRLQFINLTF